jgi:hypothetical protein
MRTYELNVRFSIAGLTAKVGSLSSPDRETAVRSHLRLNGR